MSEGDAILRDIIDNPDDDGLRLIYADWLEDNGQESRAEFIRLQIERWRIGGLHPPADDEDRKIIARANELDNRIAQLLRQGYFDWSPFGDDFHKQNHQALEYKRGFIHTICCTMQAWLDHGKDICAMHPVKRVELTNREPNNYEPGEWGWWSPSRFEADTLDRHMHGIPGTLFNYLSGKQINRDGEECDNGE